MRVIRTLYVYLNKDARICGYFSKLKGFREGKSLGNTDAELYSRIQPVPLSKQAVSVVKTDHSLLYRE